MKLKNYSIFTKVLACALCTVLLVGTLIASLFVGNDTEAPNSGVGVTTTVKPNSGTGTTTTVKPNTGTTTTERNPGSNTGSNTGKNPSSNNGVFSASTTIDNGALVYGALASDLAIGTVEGYNALLPADVKIAEGASSLELSVKPVETGSEIKLGAGDSAKSLDVHIDGIALDNTVPMIVNLGAVLEAGLGDTELKFYHTEDGVAVLMTRVKALSDFAIHNQYYYNPETGEVSIYVSSFSVFSAVKATADEWDGTSDITWYNDNDTSFTLTTAEQFAGFRDLVDEGTTFSGKTVKLGVDIDLAGELFDPIGYGYTYGKDSNTAFMGTFDGDGHTVYGLYQNGWELDPDKENYSTYTYSTAGGGLFASIENATIKNLAVSGANIVFECVDIGIVVGYAQGNCHFENIVVTDSIIANYNRATGGVVGEVCYGSYGTDVTRGYSHTFKNIVVDSSVVVSSLWGSFDTLCGGVIGGKWGDATVKMENVTVAAELDVFSDVTAAYEWYAYRRCGMLIGHTEQNSPKKALNAAAPFLTCENVNVYYGDWVNYTYCQFSNYRYPWARVQAGKHHAAYTNPRHSTAIDANGNLVVDDNHEHLAGDGHNVSITFDQLYGGGQGVYGCAEHDGVKTHNSLTKTIYIQNNKGWENLKLQYWFQNGEERWGTLIDGLALTEENGVYKISLPAHAHGFMIVADGENTTREFYLSEVENNGTYALDFEHIHHFGYQNKCDCGMTLKETEHKFTFGEDGEAKHSDGSGVSKYTETVGDYTLTLSNISSVYHNARDEMGNSCIKLGTSSLTGGFSFTVPNDVEKVIIYVAGYKGSNVTVEINGIPYEITTHSNDGEYTAIEVDTKETKTVSFTTVDIKDKSRCMINTIAFVTTEFVDNHTCVFSEATCTTKATCTTCGITTGDFAEHNWDDATCEAPRTCFVCGETYGEPLPHTDVDSVDHTCDVCGTKEISEHIYENGICTICGEKEPADYSGKYYIATIRTSGNYFYMTNSLGTASAKRYQAVDSGITTLPSSINDGESNKIFVLEKSENGTYSIYAEGVEGDKYLGWTSDNSGILVAKENTLELTIDKKDDGTFNIHFTGDVERYLALNQNTGSNYFAWYKSGQKQNLTLIPVIECDHENKTTKTVDATCTVAGSTTVTCVDCGATISSTEIPVINHTDDTDDNDHNCDVCGAENVTEHNYVDGICDCGAIEPTEPTPDPEPDQPEAPAEEWVKKGLAEITNDDIVVIVWTKGSTAWALTSANGSSKAPEAMVVTINGENLIGEIGDALKWNIVKDGNNLTIYPNGTTEKWLYCTNANDGVRVGTNNNKVFTIDTTSGYLKNSATSRYVGVYTTNPDVRCYTNTTGNTAAGAQCSQNF